MNINRFLKTVVRMLWVVILLGMIGGGITAYKIYYLTPELYEAETTVYALSKSSTLDGGESINYQDVILSKQLIMDYQEIITSEKVLDVATRQLQKYQITQSELKKMIKVIPKNDSSVIAISSESEDPQIAASASDAVAKAFITRVQELTNGSIVGILDEAKAPKKPISDNNIKNIFIGILAGIVAAFAIIYIKELFDTTVRYTEDVEHNIELNVVGIIPKYSIR